MKKIVFAAVMLVAMIATEASNANPRHHRMRHHRMHHSHRMHRR